MLVRRSVLAAVVVVTALGTACTGGDDGHRPASRTTATSAPTLGIEEPGSAKNPDARGPLEVPAEAIEGRTVTVLSSRAPTTLDPTRAYYTDSTAILNLVSRALTQYSFDPDTQSMVLVPDMATDLGRHNDDFTEWTFTLKSGLQYEDGSPVTADDVAYAISRSFATKELPDGPSYQRTYFLDGDRYAGPYRDGAYRGVTVDGHDITIRMSRPFPDMDYYASYPSFTGIPRDRDTRDAYGDHPLATGPYMVQDYDPGTSLTLVRNPHWDADSDPGRIQSVDEWDFEFDQDAAATERAIRGDVGAARTTLTYDNISAPTFRWFMDHAHRRLVIGTSPCTYLWYLDMRTITDIRVRRAIGYAYPYVAAWKAGGEIVGLTRIPGTAILPPGTAGRVDYDALGNQGQHTDPARSRRLLKEAHATGFEITFPYAFGDPTSEAVTKVVVAGLEAGGFTATPVEPDPTIRDRRSEDDSPVDVRPGGWCSDWPTGGSWFPAQWDGALVGRDEIANPSHFDEPDADRMQADILSGRRGDTSFAWGEFDRFLEETYYPAVNVGYAGTAVIRGSEVGGMFDDNVRGMPTFTLMYVTPHP